MRRGPLVTEKAPMRQEPLDLQRSLRRRQSGPGGGPLFRFRIQDLRPKRRKLQRLLRSPGTDGKLSCGTGVAKWTGKPVASPCRRKKTATRAKLVWPLDRHRKRCLGGTGVAKWTGKPVASPCRRKKTATRAKLVWPLDRHRKRCLGGTGVAKWTGKPVASPCRGRRRPREPSSLRRTVTRAEAGLPCRRRPSRPGR